MIWLTVAEYLCQKSTQICSVNNNPNFGPVLVYNLAMS